MTQDRPDDHDRDGEYVDPEVPTEPEAADEGGKVLSPEELDISDSEYVEPLDDEGRYVVSPGGGPPNVPDPTPESDPADGDGGRRRAPSGSEASGGDRQPQRARSPEAARTLLSEELGRSNARYGIDIVARFDGDPVRHRTASDDVIATFENLVQWYARHVTDGTPADEVIDILLRESGLAETETPNLAKLLEAHDLDRSDSIADLVAAIRKESARD
jgi:hypothetical protein